MKKMILSLFVISNMLIAMEEGNKSTSGKPLYVQPAKKYSPRKKQAKLSLKIQEIQKQLNVVTYYYKAFTNLPIIDAKSSEAYLEKRGKQFGELVEPMNDNEFLVEHILFGMKTHVQGNNSVLEKGICDRLAQAKKSLEDELQSLQ